MSAKFQVGKPLMKKVEEWAAKLTTMGNDMTDFVDEVETLVDAMNEAYEERSDPWQASERASEVQDWIGTVEEALDQLRELMQSLDTVGEQLGEFPSEPE